MKFFTKPQLLTIILCCFFVFGIYGEAISKQLPGLIGKRTDKNMETKEFLSDQYNINKIYKSMEGPASMIPVTLLDTEPPELLWIVGYRVIVVGEDGKTPVDQQFMCHNNFEFNPQFHRDLFGWTQNTSTRMFTLSQGQFTTNLPDGFGFPIMSNESFSLSSQVLNHNFKDIDVNVHHRVFVDFIRDKNLKKPLKPVFPVNGFVMALLDGKTGVYNVASPNETQKHATCLPGLNAESAFKSSLYTDKVGQKFTGHWVVKPGKEERHTRVTDLFNIPYDTTLHFISFHVHPFAEKMILKDLTTGKTVFEGKMTGPKDGIGIEKINHFTSEKGIPIYKDHEYDMISFYNNTSGIDQDAMASMFLYLADKEFQKPDKNLIKRLAISDQNIQKRVLPLKFDFKKVTLPVKLSDEKVVLHTIAGDIVFAFYPEVAPKHTEQVKKLIAMGAFDTTHFYRVEPEFIIQVSTLYDRKGEALTNEQIAAIQPLKAEFSDLKHVRGVLSMARLTDNPDSGDTSFYIMLGSAPHLDEKYTIFGEVVAGFDTIDQIVSMPQTKQFTPDERIEITSAEILQNDKLPFNLKHPPMSTE